MSDGKTRDNALDDEPPKGKPANVAPDAVKDPNEKTGGKPGMGPQGNKGSGEEKPGGEADPGGG